MHKNLIVGDTIQTKLGPGKIRKIGEPSGSLNGRSQHRWPLISSVSMHQHGYYVAREDEIAPEVLNPGAAK